MDTKAIGNTADSKPTLTIEQFLNQVDWSKMSLSYGKFVRNEFGGCPLQVVYGMNDGYLDRAMNAGLSYRDCTRIINAADDFIIPEFDLRNEMLKRMQQ